MELKDRLSANNFTFNKALGQNFISDGNLLAAITKDANVTAADTVIEIGAGAGTLTAKLAAVAKRVIAYEVDKRLEPILTQTLSGFNNVELRFADFTKQPINRLEQELNCSYKVVANLPYYVTTPIITSLCEQSVNCLSLTVMVQEEVALRLNAVRGKEYGALSVCAQSRGEVHITRKVSRKMFTPQPNVDSAVVSIVFDGRYGDLPRKLFRQLVKGSFATRRKTLANNLMTTFSISRVAAEQLLSSNGLQADVRAEQVSVEQFAAICRLLQANNYS